VEVYELDFVELKPSLIVDGVRRSREQLKKIPSKIMIRKHPKKIQGEDGDMTPNN
jgi:hypothetical protein